jgi:sialidase-1
MRVLLFSLLCLAAAGESSLTHTEVFQAGVGGYHSYRIPAIVSTSSGALLAFAEARRDNRGDPGLGDIDLVVSRSTDQGKTWSPMQVIDDPGEKWSASNPVPLLDRSNGRVWIFFNRWQPGYGTDKSEPGKPHNQMWARSSDDHGVTWSAPRDLTRASRDYDNWGAMFLGPGGAIQMKSGRLVLPAAMKADAFSVQATVGSFTGSLGLMRAYVIYSNDQGQTWKRGALAPALTNENQLMELADGKLLMDARQNNGDHRWFLTSADGGQTWLRPRVGIAVSPVATGIERFGNTLLWSGPALANRQKLVIRVSEDEGQTWNRERVVYGGFAAYSDLEILADSTIGILWERGSTEGYQSITFTRLNRDFLDAPPGH